MSIRVTFQGRTIDIVNSKLGSTMKLLMIGVNSPTDNYIIMGSLSDTGHLIMISIALILTHVSMTYTSTFLPAKFIEIK